MTLPSKRVTCHLVFLSSCLGVGEVIDRVEVFP